MFRILIREENRMIGKLRSKAGITLIELMSTVVIIGIVSSMAAPRFQKAAEKVSFRTSNRGISSTMRKARSKAISEKTPYGIYFVTGAQGSGGTGTVLTYTLFEDKVGFDVFSFAAGDSVISVDTLPQDFSLLGTDIPANCIIFQPNGSAAFSGGGNIFALATTPNLVALVTHNVLASTGRVKTTGTYY